MYSAISDMSSMMSLPDVNTSLLLEPKRFIAPFQIRLSDVAEYQADLQMEIEGHIEVSKDQILVIRDKSTQQV